MSKGLDPGMHKTMIAGTPDLMSTYCKQIQTLFLVMESSMMKVLITLVAFAIPSLLAAQAKHHVLPAGYEGLQDTYTDQGLLGGPGKNRFGNVNTPMHIQTGYAMSDLGSSILKIGSISYRRNNYYSNDLARSTQSLAIYMSRSAVKTSAYSSSFAKNSGPVRTQVFGKAGKPAVLNWPSSPHISNGQKVVPFLLKIPLASPYLVTSLAGKSLCIDFDIRTRVVTPKTGPYVTPIYSLILDAAGTAHGTMSANGNAGLYCTFSSTKWFQMGRTMTTAGLTTDGGTLDFAYYMVPANAVGIATISGMGVNTKPNRFKLPIDLGPLGMPNCRWNVGLETGFWVALKANAKGAMHWPTVKIPAGLPPMNFYDQGLVIDRAANRLGLVATSSAKWSLVQARHPKCVTVYKFQDTSPPASSGRVAPSFAAVVRLDV